MKIPKLKNRAFIIDLHIYPVKVFVVIGNPKQIKPLLLNYKNPPTEKDLEILDSDLIFDGYYGLSYQLKYNSNFLIWIAKDAPIFDIIPHEVLHCVQDIFRHIGEKNLSEDNTEAFCYLNGYINQKIFEQI
jgi:hypothetical protein